MEGGGGSSDDDDAGRFRFVVVDDGISLVDLDVGGTTNVVVLPVAWTIFPCFRVPAATFGGHVDLRPAL